MKYLLFYTLLSGCCLIQDILAQDQSFEEYRKQMKANFNQYKQQEKNKFDQYRKQRNAEFKNYLVQAWEELNTFKGIEPPQMPQPFVPEQEKKEKDTRPTVPTVPEQYPIKEIVQPTPIPQPKKQVVIIPSKETTPTIKEKNINFYGISIKVRDCHLSNITLSTNNREDVARTWEMINKAGIDPLIYDCQKAREKFKMCDWAFYQLLKQVSLSFWSKTNHNMHSLFIGYVLANSNIDFRFVQHSNQLSLALPTNCDIYCTVFISQNNKKYYLLESPEEKQIYLMPHAFSTNAEVLNMTTPYPMRYPFNTGDKKITLTSKKYPSVTIQLNSNQQLLNFYSSYPRMDWNIYAKSELCENTRNSVLQSLSTSIQEKNEEDAVNMILNFVQTAFTYGYDDQIWGRDRPFFPEETLNYPFSDCEDRAILFSYLIKRLTKLDVVLLHYPNHLATAVRFNMPRQGDFVMVDGIKYLVCDPTGYKPIGNAYDQFKKVAAKVIKL